MEVEEVFADDVSEADFLLETLPDLHRDRLDLFETFCETTLRFSVHLTDRDERFSVELAPDGARARRGTFIDFPVVTLKGETGPWEVVKRHLREAFEKGEEALRSDPPTDRIDADFLAELERLDAIFEITLSFPDLDSPVEFEIILNDYQPPPDPRRLRISVDAADVDDVLAGRRSAEEAARSLDISGDMSLAFDLSGLLLNHFPELED